MVERSKMPPELRNMHRTRPYHAIAGAWREHVALACSGGVDSTALLLLAARAVRQGRVGAFTVIHVDHRERVESDGDAQFVAELCERLNLPFRLLRFEQRLPSVTGLSREAQLRDERYRVIAETCVSLGLLAVVTAHTLDDQAETILMRLIAGSGPIGAAGMRTSTTISTAVGALQVLRPLLAVSRAELESVLFVAGITPRYDITNEDPAYRRNALRANVVPALRELEPGFAAALVRSAELARDDGLVCDEIAEARYEQWIERSGSGLRVSRAAVRAGAPAIARRVLRSAILELADVEGRELSYERVEAVRLAAARRAGASIELPGGVLATIEREWVRLALTERTARTEEADA